MSVKISSNGGGMDISFSGQELYIHTVMYTYTIINDSVQL